LLGLAWISGFTLLAFVAWIPFFFTENAVLASTIKKKKRFLFWLAYLTFLVWNITDTWWVMYASVGGAVLAITCNSLLMAFTYWLYLFSTQKISSNFRVLLFIPFWMGFEYFHTDWDLSWTWLTLGNVFAFKTSWVQWYEYTGVSGGSLWVLLVNCLAFLSIVEFKNYQLGRKAVLIIAVLVIVYAPIELSEYVLEHYLVHSPSTQTVKGQTVNVLVVQPSFDPYEEKFLRYDKETQKYKGIPFPEQFKQTMALLRGKIDSSTDYIVLPETYIVSQYADDDIYEDKFREHPYINFFYDSILSKFPNVTIVSGADTYYRYGKNETHQPTARKYSGGTPGDEEWYESFNSAVQIAAGKPVEVYHKSKLVPGVEMMPFPTVFGPLAELAIEMGGTSGSLGKQNEREVFAGPKGARVAPIICYESVFGEYVTEYVRKGANILFIVTNDAWWYDTPGYKQHLAYGALRAIETRRYIARSANTGISCIIDDAGEIHHPAKWYEKTVISYSVPLIDWETFYVRNGDWLSKIMSWAAVFLLLLGIFLWLRGRQTEKKKAHDKQTEKNKIMGIDRVKNS
jgi:apolipoprotein N-acyltransferase